MILKHYQVSFGRPAVAVFGTDGELAKGFDGRPSYENEVTSLVQQLLEPTP